MGLDGGRFRVRFCISEEGRVTADAAQKGTVGYSRRHKTDQVERSFHIYALLAFSATSARCACYVAQTVHPRRRMREHLIRASLGRGSAPLFAWARMEGTRVLCVELETRFCTPNEAGELERLWTGRAIHAGFETPGIEQWGRAPLAGRDICDVDAWPSERVRLLARSLADVVNARQSLPAL